MPIKKIKPNPWRRLTILILAVGVVALVLFAQWALPIYLKQKIEKTIAENCPRCEFQVEGLTLRFFTGLIGLKNMKFVNDPHSPTSIHIEADEIKVWASVSKFVFLRKNVIERIEMSHPVVVIQETYNPHHPKPKPQELEKIEASYGGEFLEDLPPIVVNSVFLENAKLEYVLNVLGRYARISVSDINAEMSPFGTRRDLAPRFIDAHVTGKVQKSGLLSFNLKADLFSVKNEDRIEIEIQHLPMAELDTFFTKEDGLLMSGEIHKVHTLVLLSQGKLTGEMSANYENLSVTVKPGPTVGVIQALFMNVVQKLKIAKTKPDPQKPPPRAAVDYVRQPGQSLVTFILQGLKGAAFKVIAN